MAGNKRHGHKAAELLQAAAAATAAIVNGQCSSCLSPHASTASVNGWLLFDFSSSVDSSIQSLLLLIVIVSALALVVACSM